MNTAPHPDDTPEILGEKLAQRLKWDGRAISAAMLAALTEANFHTLRAELERVILNHLEG